MNTNKQRQMEKVLANTRGRFFGLQTKSGEQINAQLVGVSPHYVRVRDNNTNQERKFAKTSLTALSVGGLRYHA